MTKEDTIEDVIKRVQQEWLTYTLPDLSEQIAKAIKQHYLGKLPKDGKKYLEVKVMEEMIPQEKGMVVIEIPSIPVLQTSSFEIPLDELTTLADVRKVIGGEE